MVRTPSLAVQPAEPQDTLEGDLDRIADWLTDQDDVLRRSAVEHFVTKSIPDALTLIVKRLIKRLTHGKGLAHRAAASLLEIGEPAVVPLRQELLTTRSAAMQMRLAKVLAEVGRTLPVDKRRRIDGELVIALCGASSDKAALAIARASNKLQAWR
jgi:hypothetical protein